MAKHETYAALLRRGMRAKGMNKRDLERALAKGGRGGYSYEHIRKVTSGLPVMSEQFNRDICEVLELEEDLLWQAAAKEKLKSSPRTAHLIDAAGPDSSLRDDWAELSTADRERVGAIVKGLAEQRRIERVERDTDNPELIRAKILEMMNRLGPAAAEPRHKKTKRG